jgi:hypothetical protein
LSCLEHNEDADEDEADVVDAEEHDDDNER